MMVSSKFGGRLPVFKVPAICKKKLVPVPPPQGDPLPNEMVLGELHIHGWYPGPYRIDRDADLPMPKVSNILYRSQWPPPPAGEVIWMNWNPDTYVWSGGLRIYGVAPFFLTFGEFIHEYEPDGTFDTGTFDWDVPPTFIGQKDGRYHNPIP